MSLYYRKSKCEYLKHSHRRKHNIYCDKLTFNWCKLLKTSTIKKYIIMWRFDCFN